MEMVTCLCFRCQVVHWSMTSDLFPVDAVIGVGPVFTEFEFIFLPLSPSPAAVPFFL